MEKETAVIDLLAQLEQVMQSYNLWQVESLPESAFQSSAPFCCDTMTFQQWLQFVLIPKLRECCKTKTLPSQMGVAAMAEMSLDINPNTPTIVMLLKQLDTLVTGEQ